MWIYMGRDTPTGQICQEEVFPWAANLGKNGKVPGKLGQTGYARCGKQTNNTVNQLLLQFLELINKKT